jgi:hypothetical protein
VFVSRVLKKNALITCKNAWFATGVCLEHLFRSVDRILLAPVRLLASVRLDTYVSAEQIFMKFGILRPY